MHIESLSIENYKSFLERQSFQFEPGFNLLVGANNAGKTTVLDILDMDSSLNEPHRSNRTIPHRGGQTHQLSELEVALATSFTELRMLVGWNQVHLPLTAQVNESEPDIAELQARILGFAAENGDLTLRVAFGHGVDAVTLEGSDLIFGRASRQAPNDPMRVALLQYSTIDAAPQVQVANMSGVNGVVGSYYLHLRQRVYRFNAQRRPGGECAAMGTVQLDREAVALPYCINHLNTNDPHGHQLLCEWISRIFPSIQWVHAPPIGGNFQLRCLTHAPRDRRDDLSTPLSRMGTGIGNVIAMLYVVLTSRDPQVIAIDEPNAFLHPRALRELLAILETEGRQHQYFLTAHSADVLTAVNARTISLLDFDGTATAVKQVGPKDLHQLRSGLADLGIRMTDLHARDRVLWVEGQTEELVMPELLRYACPEVAAGTAVLRVERTGTFSKKGVDPDEVVKIYERLSASSALVPPMVAILLDGETRTAEERQVIESRSVGKLRFLDRAMLENYLLDSGAVAAVLAELGQPTSQGSAESALCTARGASDFPMDVAALDGAAILGQVFLQLSESKFEFRKTRDVPALVGWFLENDRSRLDPLRVCLRKTFGLPA